MENRNQKVVTFQNHYGAMMLKKKLGDCCSLKAVPRVLSSSCGTCVFVNDVETDIILDASQTDLLEGIYIVKENGYEKIYG